MNITDAHFNFYFVCRYKLWFNVVSGKPAETDYSVPTALIKSGDDNVLPIFCPCQSMIELKRNSAWRRMGG